MLSPVTGDIFVIESDQFAGSFPLGLEVKWSTLHPRFLGSSPGRTLFFSLCSKLKFFSVKIAMSDFCLSAQVLSV